MGNDVFEKRKSTRSGLSEFVSSCYAQIFGQIVSMRVKKLSSTKLIASRHIRRENASFLVDVRNAFV